MCKDRKRLLNDIDSLIENKEMWYRRAWILRAIIRGEVQELYEITKDDLKWKAAWYWVKDNTEESLKKALHQQ